MEMDKTKIEWCDSTWNPVTGCLHNCEYCYARNMARRFASRVDPDPGHGWGDSQCSGKECEAGHCHVLDGDSIRDEIRGESPYPYGFDPTFHKQRLEIPARWTRPRNIFVCSMADLFGNWVPDEWIEQVFDACETAPQHKYLFLTKNPGRLHNMIIEGKTRYRSGFLFGQSITGGKAIGMGFGNREFISFEPLLAPVIISPLLCFRWAIIGAESGRRKDKVIPKKEWVDEICEACDRRGIPVFMKDSLLPVMGEASMRREFPPELRREPT
jgi:protein gp37